MDMTAKQLGSLIGAYAEMVQVRWDNGWTPYLLSIKFDEISGGPVKRKAVMEEEIHELFVFILCHTHKRPHGKPADDLPLMIAIPDDPVFKRNKDMLRNIAINDGLHYHAILVIPPWSRMSKPLEDALFERANRRKNSCMLLPHVEPITHATDFVTDYAFKGLKSGRNSGDDLLVFPYSRSELPSRREKREQASDYHVQRARDDHRNADTRSKEMKNLREEFLPQVVQQLNMRQVLEPSKPETSKS